MKQGGALASEASQGGEDGSAMQQVVNAAPGMQLSQMSVGELENLVLSESGVVLSQLGAMTISGLLYSDCGPQCGTQIVCVVKS